MNRKYIASGFREDMELLFTRFMTCEHQKEISLRFSRFCSLWREMNFSFVFKMRSNVNDLRELIDEIYLEVMPNVSEEHRFERRVCALYLLYSLYVKQPKVSNKSIAQKIRINFSYLDQIRGLVQKCKQLEQLDVCYVWYKLLSLGAIDLVHVSRLMGPQYIRNSKVTNETQTQTDFLIDQFRSSLEPPIDELSHIHEKYRTLKEALIEENEQMKELDQIQDNMFELSKAKMNNLHKEFTNTSTTGLSTEPYDHLMDSESEKCEETNERTLYNIGDKRRQLKEKALGFGATAQANEPTVESNVGQNCTTNTNEMNSQLKPKRSRGRPKICKLTQIQ